MGNEELEKENEKEGGDKKRKRQIQVKTDLNDEINKDKYIKKISMIQNEIELNKSREKIFKKTALIFNKKLKNLDELSAITDLKLDKLIDKMCKMNLEKKKENRIHKREPKNKLLLEKSLQLKSEQATIKILTSENKKLKEENENLNKKLLCSDDFSQFDKIGLKNLEIKELKKKNIELSKNYEKIKSMNISLKTKNEQLEEIILRFKKKIFELQNEKLETNRDKSFKIETKNNKKIINIKKFNRNNNNNKLLRSTSVMYFRGIRKDRKIRELLKDSYYHLLNDKERNSLRNLFTSDEEFMNFSNKLDIIETRNKRVELNLEKEISNLHKTINEQKEEIENLKKDIELRDKKIKCLESQLNELKGKNKKLINDKKRNLSEENQLKKDGIKINIACDNDKKKKADILINRSKEELDKDYIEKCKEKEINKINKEIGDIYFLDSKFFEKFKKNKNKDINPNNETK